ncbi:MAG TPA: DUF58 domain-containing protein, partial [Acidothermaceae bacterium]
MAESVVPTAGVRRVRITPNGWAALAGAGLMFALAVQTKSVWMQVVGSALLGLLGISALSVVRRRPGLAVSMQAPTEVFVGAPFDIRIAVSNTGRQTTPPLRITYDVNVNPPPVAPALVYVDPVAVGDTAVLSVTRVPLRRGAAGSSRLVVDMIGSFGFFTCSYAVAGTPAFFAAPLAAAPIDVTRALSSEAGGSGPMGAGLDVRGVREWRPGDAVRHVHWRSTARTGHLSVLEYGEPTIDMFGVLIAGTRADPRFEAELALAASTTWQGLDDGVMVVITVADDAIPNVKLLKSKAADPELLRLSPTGYHKIFAGLRAAVPDAETVDGLLAHVGAGGIVLLATGDGLADGFVSYVEAAASATGVRLIRVA